MYKTITNVQISFDDFNQSCGMQLDKDNEWVRLSEIIPWNEFEEGYEKNFPGTNGRVAYSFRVAFGSLFIQTRLNLKDRALVKTICENPYLQYFIGYQKFDKEKPFAPTSLVYFRKRMRPEFLQDVNERLTEVLQEGAEKASEARPKKRGRKKEEEKPDENGNLGTAICDATCAPANIRFPQDFSLLNEAREKLEEMIDWFCREYCFDGKPRTYRRIARKEYLGLAKSKKRSEENIRSTVRKMLNYVRRDLGYLGTYMHEGYCPDRKYINLYLTILKLDEQQEYMWENHIHRVDDRIVSLRQPWVRPIVRGKVKAPVEFGAKFEVLLDENGYARMEKCSFNAFNESEDLQDALTRYNERTGHWPKRVLVDQIYRTRSNRAFCKGHGIRMSGPSLGRPAKEKQTEEGRRAGYKDNTDRIGVERFFSDGKRCNGMGLIMTKLEDTTMTSIMMSMIVTNIFRHREGFSFFIFYFVDSDEQSVSEFAFFDPEADAA